MPPLSSVPVTAAPVKLPGGGVFSLWDPIKGQARPVPRCHFIVGVAGCQKARRAAFVYLRRYTNIYGVFAEGLKTPMVQGFSATFAEGERTQKSTYAYTKIDVPKRLEAPAKGLHFLWDSRDSYSIVMPVISRPAFASWYPLMYPRSFHTSSTALICFCWRPFSVRVVGASMPVSS